MQKIYNITIKRKNKINLPEKKSITKYDNTINRYMKDLEDKINIMKKGYIQALIEKHFEKDENKKMEIILKANIPKKRNEVKKTFKELMELLKNEFDVQNQKYYYLIILNILNKYKNINEDEIRKMMKLYKQKRNKNNIKNNDKNKINKYKYNYDNNNDNDNDNEWISNKQNSKKGFIVKVFTFLIPLAYIIKYCYANYKD